MNFKQIKGYEGIYSVSDCGSVKNDLTGELKKLSTDKDGYKFVSLYYGKQKTFRVHRLVALEFIENPENNPVVNHKNKDRADNRVSNLEWCTVEYNNQHALSKSCKLIDPNGSVVSVFNYSEFARVMGMTNSKVSELSLGKIDSYKGWRLYRDHLEGVKFDFDTPRNSKSYICISPSGVEYKIKNLKRFCDANRLCNSKMVGVAKGRQKKHKGWMCKYAN